MTRIVFMGTPDFAVPTLRLLIDRFDVIGVVTQPDRPAGRGGEMRLSPVKQVALDADIPVFQPEKIRQPDAIEHLRDWPADVYVVAAFGQILPQALLDIPPLGSLNVHASLLPRWRGAAPIQAAILAGDAQTGITIMKMDVGLDTGPMLSQSAIPIQPLETGESLHQRLAQLGAELLAATLPGYLSGAIEPRPQPEAGVTHAPQISKTQGRIDWQNPADAIERQVRAFYPWPGAYTTWEDKTLKIHSATISAGELEPGSVAGQGERVMVGTGDGVLCPTRVQLAGRKAVSIDDFVRGHGHFIGARLR